MSLSHIFTVSITLFAIIDILGAIPVIISLKERLGRIHAERATLISGVLMIAFLFLGQSILEMVHLDVSSFALAGAFVIFVMAIEMVLGVEIFRHEEGGKLSSVFPIAFPLVAGAGTLTTLISLRSTYTDQEVVVGILINLVFVYIVLRLTNQIERLLGKDGIAVMRRVFGIVLLAIAIKLFKENIAFNVIIQPT
jgi:multiple antibiotic resistance protein